MLGEPIAPPAVPVPPTPPTPPDAAPPALAPPLVPPPALPPPEPAACAASVAKSTPATATVRASVDADFNSAAIILNLRTVLVTR